MPGPLVADMPVGTTQSIDGLLFTKQADGTWRTADGFTISGASVQTALGSDDFDTGTTTLSESGVPFQQTDVPGVSFDRSQGQYVETTTKFVANDALGPGLHRVSENNVISTAEYTKRLTDFLTANSTGPRPSFTHAIDQDGTLVFFADGREVSRTEGFGTGREQELEDAGIQRAFITSERRAGEAFDRREGETQRNFDARQAAIDRASRDAELAARIAAQDAQRRFEIQQFNIQQRRIFEQDQLAAASQFAQLISLTDPAALPAFALAGGGNISNALAGGASALSENALLPAAQTLRGIHEAQAPSPVQFSPTPFSPFVFDPSAFETGPVIDSSFVPGGSATMTEGGGVITGLTPAQIAAANASNVIPSMAHGGVSDGVALVGDQGPEIVKALPGGGFEVIPIDGPAPAGIPKASHGGRFGTGGTGFAQPGDQPFIDETRELREDVDTSFPLGVNPFDVRFNLLLPGLRDRFFAARQSRFGIPVLDQAFEQARFALGGIGRGQLGLGV